MKHLIAATAAAGLLAACAAPATQPAPTATVTQPAPAVTVTEQSAPRPAVTVTEQAPSLSDDEVSAIALDYTLDALPPSELAQMCLYVGAAPQQAFADFNMGADGAFTFAQFLAAFDRAC